MTLDMVGYSFYVYIFYVYISATMDTLNAAYDLINGVEAAKKELMLAAVLGE